MTGASSPVVGRLFAVGLQMFGAWQAHLTLCLGQSWGRGQQGESGGKMPQGEGGLRQTREGRRLSPTDTPHPTCL